jgi:hypothetical protein
MKKRYKKREHHVRQDCRMRSRAFYFLFALERL